jgi:hypothetical protein
LVVRRGLTRLADILLGFEPKSWAIEKRHRTVTEELQFRPVVGLPLRRVTTPMISMDADPDFGGGRF